jgi:hypothetical protein
MLRHCSINLKRALQKIERANIKDSSGCQGTCEGAGKEIQIENTNQKDSPMFSMNGARIEM